LGKLTTHFQKTPNIPAVNVQKTNGAATWLPPSTVFADILLIHPPTPNFAGFL